MDRKVNRIKQLKEIGFKESSAGSYKKGGNFTITNKSIREFSNEQWDNLIEPFLDKT